MAFAMSLPRTKRVKYFNPDGTEVFQEEDRWSLVRAVHSNHQVGSVCLPDTGVAVALQQEADIEDFTF